MSPLFIRQLLGFLGGLFHGFIHFFSGFFLVKREKSIELIPLLPGLVGLYLFMIQKTLFIVSGSSRQ